MGFIKAFGGAISSTFADQWKDYLVPRSDVPATAAVFQAVPNGGGENTKGNANIISNGSKIVVPEGCGLITIQDGAITGFIAEAGGFEFKSDDVNSQSLFAGDGIFSSTLKSSWEKVKFGGVPGTQQLAFYVNLKEIPGLRFGTQTPVPYDDAFLATEVSVVANGTYSLKIVDPLIFVKTFVPVSYLQPGAPCFDFNDLDNPAGDQLFKELVGSLGGALTAYSNDPTKNGRLAGIKSDQVGFAKVLSDEVEKNYQWKTNRGLEISNANIDITYDAATRKLLEEAREDDREIRKAQRMGAAYSTNMPGMMAAASGQAMQNAASNPNGSMMGFMGMNMAGQAGANMMGAATNMQQAQPQAAPAEDPYTKLAEMKKLLDSGVITQEDFDAAKKQLLGI